MTSKEILASLKESSARLIASLNEQLDGNQIAAIQEGIRERDCAIEALQAQIEVDIADIQRRQAEIARDMTVVRLDIQSIISTAILSERQSIAQLITQEADKIEESSGPKAYRIPSSEVARLRNLATLILSLPIPPTP